MSGTTSDVVALRLAESGLTIDRWVEYTFNSHFLTPTDAFSFTVAHESIPDEVKSALQPGAKVQLILNGAPQSTGFIDSVSFSKDRSNGTEIQIEGRDVLSPAVDANADPRVRFAEGSTLYDFVLGVLRPFGLRSLTESDAKNRGVITGQLRGTRTTKTGKTIRSVKLHQLKPYPGEGAFSFVSRVSQRHGRWIWASADGTEAVVDSPDFTTEPIGSVRRKLRGEQSNVIGGTVRKSLEEQPSVIVAQGFSGGGEFSRARMTAIAPNPALDVDISAIRAAYPDARLVEIPFAYPKLSNRIARPMFLHDDESKTPDQLANFVRREMALRLRKTLDATYTMLGHTYEDPDGRKVPWCVNSVVDVDDDAAGVRERLWVMARTFTKSRGSGTMTTLELVRLNTLVF